MAVFTSKHGLSLEERAKMRVRFSGEYGGFVCVRDGQETPLKATTFREAVSEAFDKFYHPGVRSGNVASRRKTR